MDRTAEPAPEQKVSRNRSRAGGRRALLQIAAASIAATAASRALEPGSALAFTSINVDQDNAATTFTGVSNSSGDYPAFTGKNTAASGASRRGLLGVVGNGAPAPLALDGVGVQGYSISGSTRFGVVGEAHGVGENSNHLETYGVFGLADGSLDAVGVAGISGPGIGVGGISTSSFGVKGASDDHVGILGYAGTSGAETAVPAGVGVAGYGRQDNQVGVLGVAGDLVTPTVPTGVGVAGYSTTEEKIGVLGVAADGGYGVFGKVGPGSLGAGVIAVSEDHSSPALKVTGLDLGVQIEGRATLETSTGVTALEVRNTWSDSFRGKAIVGWMGTGTPSNVAGVGVHGYSNVGKRFGVVGETEGKGVGVRGFSPTAQGVGVLGESLGVAIQGYSPSKQGTGVLGESTGKGVVGRSGSGKPATRNGVGVHGYSSTGERTGVFGEGYTRDGVGVAGLTDSGVGVAGNATTGAGVQGSANGKAGMGVGGYALGEGSTGVYATALARSAVAVLGFHPKSGTAIEGLARGAGAIAIQATAPEEDSTGISVRADGKGSRGIGAVATNGVALIAAGKHGIRAFGDDIAISASSRTLALAVQGLSQFVGESQFSGRVLLRPSPEAEPPKNGLAGHLMVDSRNRLWFCKKGGAAAQWVQIA